MKVAESKLNAQVMEGFVNSVLRSNFDRPVGTPDFHREIWAMVTSPARKVAIAAPRHHAKSTIVTHAYTLASALFRESRYILIVSDTFTQSLLFLGDIKKELIGNDQLRSLFSVKGLVKDTEDDLICECEDGYTFRIQAKGSEQKLRGLKWASLRPDLIVVDDLENEEACATRERRVKLLRWFYGALVPCVSTTGKIRVVGTILHLDSLLNNLMPEAQVSNIRGAGKSALIREDLREYTTNVTPWVSRKYRAHTDDFSKLLWPEMKTAEEFKILKQDYVRQGLADVYSQEMLNVPLDIGDTFFKKSDFVPMKHEDQTRHLIFYVTCDLAVSTSTKADYSAFVVGGMDSDGKLYCKHVIRERMDALEITETIFMLNRIYRPVLFGFEAGVISKAIGPYLNEAMLKRGEFISLAMLKPSGDKLTRARSIQARMRSGACRFDKDAEWYQTFEDEMLQFPRARNDDQVDAFAYLGLMLDKMFDAPTAKEMQDAEYQEFSREQAEEGRSEVCGY